MKTSELTGAALDWAVAKCIWPEEIGNTVPFHQDGSDYAPSRKWAHGGPIIERAEIFLAKSILGGWRSSIYLQDDHCIMGEGETPLVAAMRCYVESKLGEEVDLPGELA